MKAKTHDIYPYRANAQAAVNTFQKTYTEKGDAETQRILQEFIDYHISTNSLKPQTKCKYYYDFSSMAKHFKKPLTAFNERDMVELCTRLREDTKHSERTLEDYFIKLKAFYRWLRIRIRKGYVEAGKDLQNAIDYLLEEHKFRIDKDKLPKPTYVTESDVITLINSTQELREKALLALLWASGCRVGEILTLQMQDVKPLSNGLSGKGFKIELRKSKTTERTIPVLEERRVNATRYLRTWIEQRLRDGAADDAALFVNIHGEPLEYRAAKKQLDKTATSANLGKRITFHGIRKGRATDLAEKGWKEAQMNQIMGWRHGSRMPAVYIQRAGVDVTRRMAEDHGLVDAEEVQQQYLTCSGCGTENDHDKEFCTLCGNAIGEQAVKAQEEYLERVVMEREEALLERLREKFNLT